MHTEVPLNSNGLVVKFRPLRFKDLNDLTSWIRSQAIKAAVNAGVSVDSAIANVGSLSWATAEGRRYLKSTDGVIIVFRLSLDEDDRSRWNDEELYNILKDCPETELNIWKAFLEINGFGTATAASNNGSGSKSDPPNPS